LIKTLLNPAPITTNDERIEGGPLAVRSASTALAQVAMTVLVQRERFPAWGRHGPDTTISVMLFTGAGVHHFLRGMILAARDPEKFLRSHSYQSAWAFIPLSNRENLIGD
jgi:hypothetical protein